MTSQEIAQSHALSVQFGCGTVCPTGWLNFDVSPTMLLSRLPLAQRILKLPAWNKSVRYGDVVRGLPVKDNSATRVYSDQVLEHLPLHHCRIALRNVHRILKPGGVFRFFVPDLEYFVRIYETARANADANAAHDLLISTGLGLQHRRLGTIGRMLDALRNSNHLWGWDEASMGKELADAGFVRVRRIRYGDTEDREFYAIEQFSEFKNCDKSLGMEACKKG